MSSVTELKLLTLLNVTAIKRPRELDLPGGHRASPSTSRRGSLSLNGTGEGRQKKRRKSVVFGGEVGPSGSTYGNKAKKEKGSGKAKGRGKGKEEVDGGEGAINGIVSNGHAGEVDLGSNGLDWLEAGDGSDEEGESSAAAQDRWNVHFSAEPQLLSPEAIASADARDWRTERRSIPGYGRFVEQRPAKSTPIDSGIKNRITPQLLSTLQAGAPSALVSAALGQLGTYQDVYAHSLDGESDGSERKLYGDEKEALRKAAVVHALNHVLKTRRRIVRNNEKLAHAASSGEMIDPPRDQSFTRPKVLFLLPLRSLALHYLSNHLFPLAPKGTQIENRSPFTTSFSIPAGMDDPLSRPSASDNFPIDHIVNFRGNSDDNFRFGIKITRKAWRVVMPPCNEAKLMECDILVTSPLGFKMAAEREDSDDLLSSIEVAIVDGADVMAMQNWDHVKYIFQHLNEIPKSPHGCDFSRVKPWYLESQAKYLRQTILLSRFDSPENRNLLNTHCHNLAGRLRLEKADAHDGVLGRVRSGVRQVFERVDEQGGMGGEEAVEEGERRLSWFTKKTIPALLRSAISRQNTLIVIPSYFDFVRVTNHLRKTDSVSYVAISEYSSNAEISRARTLFFKSKKSFLVVTERFHFYRRYLLRGAKTIVWYQPPEHAQFYAEFLRTPFLPSSKAESETDVEIDEGEVSCRTLFNRFDALRMERVVGSENWRKITGSGEARFEFV
ncbi:rRNA-binding ribosome biosynthesis protein utp25 [Saitozyma podzolica]|uniref:U3 small nucleolar RNA-associated protein 25 n=1 Tax=Saitozyma podzolica TaxID=1890683 RepID=A0A427YCQ6_9TREE|nr:rRNA-binding ribosome biosynthesis protein utp25 [Saitozyma podzolica]